MARLLRPCHRCGSPHSAPWRHDPVLGSHQLAAAMRAPSQSAQATAGAQPMTTSYAGRVIRRMFLPSSVAVRAPLSVSTARPRAIKTSATVSSKCRTSPCLSRIINWYCSPERRSPNISIVRLRFRGARDSSNCEGQSRVKKATGLGARFQVEELQ